MVVRSAALVAGFRATLEVAYHGHTTSLIDLSPYKHAGPGGGGARPWVHVAPLPDGYRGRYREDNHDQYDDPVPCHVDFSLSCVVVCEGHHLSTTIFRVCENEGAVSL